MDRNFASHLCHVWVGIGMNVRPLKITFQMMLMLYGRTGIKMPLWLYTTRPMPQTECSHVRRWIQMPVRLTVDEDLWPKYCWACSTSGPPNSTEVVTMLDIASSAYKREETRKQDVDFTTSPKKYFLLISCESIFFNIVLNIFSEQKHFLSTTKHGKISFHWGSSP